MSRFNACPNCHSSQIAPRRKYEALSLALCGACGFVFDTRKPTEAELSAHYAQYAYGALKPCPPATQASYEQLLDRFEPFRKTGHILDVGCGQGDFLVQAKARGWTVHGTEFSPSGVALCRDRGLDMHEGALGPDVFAGITFDIITSFEVFEHINAGAEELALFHAKLRPGGLAYLTTPNFNALLRWLEGEGFKMIAYPEHISFYTARSLRALGQASGFGVRWVRTTGLDLGRLRRSLRAPSRQAPAGAGPQADNRQADNRRADRAVTQQARDRIQQKPHLRALKSGINALLSLFGVGDTLKAWMVKPDPAP